MNLIKYLFKIIIVTIISIIYFIFLLFNIILVFIIPGKCDQCIRKKWNWFRNIVINENDTPLAHCRTCKRNNKEIYQEK